MMIPEIARRLGLDASQPVDQKIYLLIQDLRGRRGLRQTWDSIEDDDVLEIVAKWRAILSGTTDASGVVAATAVSDIVNDWGTSNLECECEACQATKRGDNGL
jgi:hypothetical protein